MMSNRRALRVIVQLEGDQYVAQCIDYDIAGAGPDPERAISDFVDAFLRHILVAVERKEVPLASVPQPPQEYRDRWYGEEAARSGEPRAFTIPRFKIRDIADFDDSLVPHNGEATIVQQCA